jgi:hypothetical protein
LLQHSHAITARPAVAPYRLRAVPVVADRFDRTAFHGFFAESLFFWRLRLFIDVRMAAVIISFEIGGRGFAAQIAVDALIIYVEFAGDIFGVFVCGIGHGFSVKNDGKGSEETLPTQ